MNWNNNANAGCWALNLNNSRTNANHNVGFRSDSELPRILKRSLYIFRKALKNKSYSSLASCLGHAKRTHSLKRMLTMIKEEINGNNLSVRKIH